MVFARIEKTIVTEIIPEFDPVFPGVPVGERYPADVIKKLVAVEDEESVHVGMIYDANTGEFSEPEQPKPVTPSEPTVDPVTEPTAKEILDVLLGVRNYE